MFTIFTSFIFGIGLSLLSPSLGQTFPANCARNYTVSSGDFCNEISATQDVSTYQLALVNQGIIDPACDNLAVDEVICLGITGQDCTSIHVVISGDQCGTIASGAGIPLTTLLANNPNVNSACNNLGLGEVLCTAGQVINYTTTATGA